MGLAISDLLSVVVCGYLAVTCFPMSRYWLNRQAGYKMFFAVLLTGCVVTLVSRQLGTLASAQLTAIGMPLPVAGDQLTFDLTWCASISLAYFGPYAASSRWRRRLAKFVSEHSGDLIEALLQEAMDRRFLVELSMENGKFYIGRPHKSGVATDTQSDVSLIPLLSGYRHGDNKTFCFTTSYRVALEAGAQRQDLREADFQVVLPKAQIVSARRFDPETYLQAFQSGEPRHEPAPAAVGTPPPVATVD